MVLATQQGVLNDNVLVEVDVVEALVGQALGEGGVEALQQQQ